MLGIGERKFVSLPIPFIKVGKTKKYTLEDIESYIEKNRQEQVSACQLKRGKVRRSTGTISQFTEIGFAEALRQTTLQQQKQ